MDIDRLIDEYYRKIYKLCLFYLGGDEPEAEELVQEIFAKVLKKQSTFKGESGEYTWLYRMAVNTLINHIKRGKIVEFFSLGGLWGNDEPHQRRADPAEILEAQDVRRRQLETLETCLSRLSHRERTAFYFYHYDGLKQKQIAQIMNTTLSAVESLLHKAKKKLKHCAGDRKP